MSNALLDKYIEIINGDKVIKMSHVLEMSLKMNVTLRQTQITLLENGITPYRYIGNVRQFGCQVQAKLLEACVCIVGCGGTGGFIIELCARLGIGRIVLVDGDIFEESNLNRQLLSNEKTLGLSKSECGKRRIIEINSALEVTTYTEFIDAGNVNSIISGCDCVMDALDNIESRLLLQNACNALTIPLIHGAIGDSHIQVSTVLPGNETLKKLYPPEISVLPVVGNTGVSPSLCASLQVAELIKLFVSENKLLANKLLIFDWLSSVFSILDIE